MPMKYKRTPPLVSICIASYNHDKYIKECIDSALGQTIISTEIIIVDDCSTDATVEEIEKYSDDRIRLLRNVKNIGLSNSLNIAISEAEGKYICISGSDDVFFPYRLERQLDFLHANSGTPLVFSDVDYIDGDSRSIPPPEGIVPASLRNQPRHMWLAEFFEGRNRLPAPTAMFEKALTDKIGGFDPRLIQTQDLDLWIRTALSFDIGIVPEKLMHYRVHGANLSSGSLGKKARLYWELSQILDRYRSISSKRLLQSIISVAEDLQGEYTSCDMCLAIHSCRHQLVFVRNFGLRLLFELLSIPEFAKHLDGLGYGCKYLFESAVNAGVYGEAADQWALEQAANWRNAYECLYAEYVQQNNVRTDAAGERDFWRQRSLELEHLLGAVGEAESSSHVIEQRSPDDIT